MAVFRRIRTASEKTPYLADGEYMFGWLSPTGGVRTWFFSASAVSRESSYKHLRVRTAGGERSYPTSHGETVEAVAEGLDKESLAYVSSILGPNYVFVVGKDGTERTVTIDGGKSVSPNASKAGAFKAKVNLPTDRRLNF